MRTAGGRLFGLSPAFVFIRIRGAVVIGAGFFEHDFTAVFPVLRITASPEIILSSVNGTCATRASPVIVDLLAFDHIATYATADSAIDDLVVLHLA